MGRSVEELKYGSFTFTVQKAGGVDSMDGFFLLAKGAIPAVEELISKGRELFESADVRKGAQAARAFMSGTDVAGTFQSPATGVVGGAEDKPGDLTALLPLLRAASKLLSTISAAERVELRRLYLFNGAIEVKYPKAGGHVAEGVKPDCHKRQLTQEVWDDLFEGDPLGAWYVFLWVLRFNLGNSSPALAAFRGLLKAKGKGGTSSSETSNTSEAGSTG
jgi:hypothetical protein